MGFQGIVFDLDGTLLDTLEDVADSANAVLRRLGFPEHPVEAYRYFIGDGMENLVRRVVPRECGDPETIGRCGALIRDEYSRHWAVKTRPYDGIPDLLDALAARGLPMAVLSNKPDELTALCVARLLPRWAFAVVLGAGPELPRKPDPAGALRIAARLRIACAQILYLGDTGTDMQTAVAAGMFPVGALWGFRTAEELRTNGARVLLSTPQELLAILDAPSPG